MPNQHHLNNLRKSCLMTTEQLQELRELDLPYCPSAFLYCKGNFPKYKGYIKLRAFRVFGWNGSADLELGMGETWRKMYDSSR